MIFFFFYTRNTFPTPPKVNIKAICYNFIIRIKFFFYFEEELLGVAIFRVYFLPLDKDIYIGKCQNLLKLKTLIQNNSNVQNVICRSIRLWQNWWLICWPPSFLREYLAILICSWWQQFEFVSIGFYTLYMYSFSNKNKTDRLINHDVFVIVVIN